MLGEEWVMWPDGLYAIYLITYRLLDLYISPIKKKCIHAICKLVRIFQISTKNVYIY